MKDVTRKYWQDNRNYFRVVKRFGKDVVGYSSNHGTGFIIGIGAASIAAGIGGYVMYRHRKRRH